MAFCWSGEKVFVPTTEGAIRILSYPELEPAFHANHATKDGNSTEFMLKGHTASCLTTELSPTGKYLATGGADSIISLFDTKDWICQRTISRMVGPVKCLSAAPPPARIDNLNADLILGFSFDGCYVVGGCEEGKAVTTSRFEQARPAYFSVI